VEHVVKNLLIFLIGFSFLLSACSQAPARSADLATRQVYITTTTGMIRDIAANVGGERVRVTGLMGPGVDPHLYKASESDVQALQDADVIFYNGLHLEAGMSFVLERMADRRKVVAVTAAIDPSRLYDSPDYPGSFDPHVWFDVSLWMNAVETVRDTLIEVDPASRQVYQQNAEAYLSELQALDAYVRQQVERIPPENRVLVTAHDAFNYFGQAYSFEVRGLQGISTESEPSTADIQQLADFITGRQIPAVFIESSVPRRNIEALQAAVRSRGWDVQIGGELFSDGMGSSGTPEGTYVGMVRHNIDTLVGALAGR
jgi:manganese/zinc/iron transport system substrate-binding protein